MGLRRSDPMDIKEADVRDDPLLTRADPWARALLVITHYASVVLMAAVLAGLPWLGIEIYFATAGHPGSVLFVLGLLVLLKLGAKGCPALPRALAGGCFATVSLLTRPLLRLMP